MYKIIIDQAHTLVRLDIEGMVSTAEADRLVDDLIAQITAAQLASYALIIDVARCPVQTQDMVATMRARLPEMKRVRALAVVTGTTLARLQVRRVFQQPFVRFTETYEDARAWTLSRIEPGSKRQHENRNPLANR